MGPDRSVLAVHNSWRVRNGKKPARCPGGYWTDQAQKWRWQERAESWDEEERECLRRKREAEIDMLFEDIKVAVQSFYGKLADRLETLDPSEIPAGVLIPQFLAIVKKLEEIYGRAPAEKLEVSGPNGQPLQVDLEERRRLLDMVDKWERSRGLSPEREAVEQDSAGKDEAPDDHWVRVEAWEREQGLTMDAIDGNS